MSLFWEEMEREDGFTIKKKIAYQVEASGLQDLMQLIPYTGIRCEKLNP